MEKKMQDETLDATDNEPEVNEVIIQFELTLDEANLILAALQELPHKAVNTLIQKIVQQGNSQVSG
jgi:hypothetical protein